MKTHINFPRQDVSTHVVTAAGYDTAAYFDGWGTGYQGMSAMLSYQRFLHSVGYTPCTHEIESFDAMVTAGVL
jgi:hypothetical protein